MKQLLIATLLGGTFLFGAGGNLPQPGDEDFIGPLPLPQQGECDFIGPLEKHIEMPTVEECE